MFKRIQKIFVAKNINKNLKKRTMYGINDPITTIGFLLNEEARINYEIFFDISSALGVQQKDTKIFSFTDIKTKTPTLIQNKIFSNHFNWRGEINNNNALDFLYTKLDVLVSYYDTKNKYLNLMTSKSKAKFNVGFMGVDNRLFDLIINVNPQKNLDVKSELLKYFKVLNKIN